MGKRILTPTALVAALALAMSLMTAGPAMSQESTPVTVEAPESNAEAEIELHPAHIHAGTCDDLGDVIYPLNDLQAAVSIADPDATPVLDLGATPDAESAMGPFEVVAQSGTEVDVSLDELLSGEFAINVHESPENIQNYLACGEIVGTPENGELFIELMELGNSGFYGQAELSDQGDDTTIVNVSIYPVDVDATPLASPES